MTSENVPLPSASVAAAAAAKLLQSCPTLCDPIDGSPPGSRPWDSPGKNTGVGCHFLLQCMKMKSESEVAQSCPTLHDPMDCSLPGSPAYYWGLKWENGSVLTIPRVLNSNLGRLLPVGVLCLLYAHLCDETFMHVIWFKPQIINKAASGRLESAVGTCRLACPVFFQEFEPWVEYNKERK